MGKFKTANIATSAITFSLFITFLFYPEIIFIIFGIDESSSAFFIGRRTAILFLGFSVLTWASQNAQHSDARQAVCLGISVSMVAMATLGIIEYVRGFAGLGISIAVVTETVLAYLYFKIWFSHRNA